MTVIDGTPIKGVIFDLDGTLYYLRRTRVRLTLRLWRSLGVVMHVGKAREAIRSRSFPDGASLRAAFGEELGRRAGLPAQEASRWYDEVFFGTFIDLLDRKARPRDRLLPFLGDLRSKGVKIAVVSDLGHVDVRLRTLGIPPEAFDVTLCAESFGELKPSPMAFLSVAEQWGIDPSEVIVVGDRVDRDAFAARAAAMQCIMLDNHAPLYGHRREHDETLYSWKEASRAITARTGISP